MIALASIATCPRDYIHPVLHDRRLTAGKQYLILAFNIIYGAEFVTVINDIGELEKFHPWRVIPDYPEPTT